MEHTILEWSVFLAFVLAMLALDLGVFNRKDHVVGPREALGWSVLWVSLALAFGGCDLVPLRRRARARST